MTTIENDVFPSAVKGLQRVTDVTTHAAMTCMFEEWLAVGIHK